MDPEIIFSTSQNTTGKRTLRKLHSNWKKEIDFTKSNNNLFRRFKLVAFDCNRSREPPDVQHLLNSCNSNWTIPVWSFGRRSYFSIFCVARDAGCDTRASKCNFQRWRSIGAPSAYPMSDGEIAGTKIPTLTRWFPNTGTHAIISDDDPNRAVQVRFPPPKEAEWKEC